MTSWEKCGVVKQQQQQSKCGATKHWTSHNVDMPSELSDVAATVAAAAAVVVLVLLFFSCFAVPSPSPSAY